MSYVITTISSDDDAVIQRIGNAVFANYALAKENGINVDASIVQNESGTELFRREK